MYSSIGVGTVTMNTRQVLRSASLVVKLSLVAEASSAASVSSVLSWPLRSSSTRVGLDVEADGAEALAELHGERQSDVAEADDADCGDCAD